MWDYHTSNLISELSGHSGSILDIAFSPDDRQIVSVAEDGSIILWCIFSSQDRNMEADK